MKNLSVRVLAILVIGLVISGDAYAQRRVAAVLKRLYPQARTTKARFAKGDRRNRLTYGHEAEFGMKNAPGLLKWFRPSDKTDKEWAGLTTEQQLEATVYGMVPTRKAPPQLKKALSSDPGGHEVITEPVNTLEDALALIDKVEATAGGDGEERSKAFYWQGNVAFKRGRGFVQENFDGILGYLKATADYAQFRKLHEGYELHLADKSFVPGKNLDHVALPPMTETHVQQEIEELRADIRGESTGSFSHLVQGTWFRTWAYGPDRSGFEIRDPHKDVAILKQELRRLTHALEQGFGAYETFRDVTMLNEDTDYTKFSPEVRATFSAAALDYEKRFAIPMRNIEAGYVTALGLTGAEAESFRTRVAKARTDYVATLEQIARNSELGQGERSKAIHVAIARFAHDTNLYPLLEERFAQGIENPEQERPARESPLVLPASQQRSARRQPTRELVLPTAL